MNDKTEIFVMKAIQVHGNKYDYSKVSYVRNSINVEIVCLSHGVFMQRPDHHLEGKGCYICGGGGRLFDRETVIKQFQVVHGDNYDYSQVEYKDGSSKVRIICKKHHIGFDQLVSDHKRGRGCVLCSGKIPKQYRDAQSLISERWGKRFRVTTAPPITKLTSKITVLDTDQNSELTLRLKDLIEGNF